MDVGFPQNAPLGDEADFRAIRASGQSGGRHGQGRSRKQLGIDAGGGNDVLDRGIAAFRQLSAASRRRRDRDLDF